MLDPLPDEQMTVWGKSFCSQVPKLEAQRQNEPILRATAISALSTEQQQQQEEGRVSFGRPLAARRLCVLLCSDCSVRAGVGVRGSCARAQPCDVFS